MARRSEAIRRLLSKFDTSGLSAMHAALLSHSPVRPRVVATSCRRRPVPVLNGQSFEGVVLPGVNKVAGGVSESPSVGQVGTYDENA